MTIPAILPVYRRSGIRMERGEGCYLIDTEGKRYLDFGAGIAVNSFGHNHPHLLDALSHQAEKLWHCSNQFSTPELEKFATRLTDATFADSVYFCSSGTEAVEAGIKFLRRYHYETDAPHRHRIITFEGGFHGRTYGGLSAGSSETARTGFGQMLLGFDRVKFNDIAAVRKAVTPNTAGILIEPIQGEGGVQIADLTFLKQLRQLCDEEEILLMCDEVQCGYGRPGSFFAFERAGIVPDIVSSAKGIGGGFPLGATLLTEKVGSVLPPGCHGGTYGGNPLAMAVGNAVLDLMLKPDLFEHVRAMGVRLLNGLKQIHKNYPGKLLDARGVGLMVGLEPAGNARDVAASLLNQGLVVSPTVTNVLRFVPALNVTAADIDKALAILDDTLKG